MPTRYREKRTYAPIEKRRNPGYPRLHAVMLESRAYDRSGLAEASREPRTGNVDPGISRQGVIRTYQRYAPIYDRIFGKVLQPGRRALTAAVHEVKAKSVLEIGVGTGLTLRDYPDVCRLVGIDLCEEMLALAHIKARELSTRKIELEAMDAEAMRYADGEFDCVTVPYVLSVTPNPERLVAEIRRVCRKGGTILIVNHFSGSRFWRLFEAVVRELAEKIGFRSDFAYAQHILGHDWEIVSVRKVNLFGLSRLVTIRNT
jgi:phosphatidylethanolamine/phosphatidyl-N-methylethanolamine N-methyltransferase